MTSGPTMTTRCFPLLLAIVACSTSSGESQTAVPDAASAEDSWVVDILITDDTTPLEDIAETQIDDAPDVLIEPDVLAEDTFIEDTGPEDTGPEDTGPEDTGPEDTGEVVQSNLFGEVTGVCGTISDQLSDPQPSFLTNVYAFDEAFDAAQLPAGPKKRFDAPNAGGSSKCTEVMSLQLMIDCETATLYKTENEVVYDTTGSLTDYVIEIDGDRVGVSVTRAYLGPVAMDYSVGQATTLLTKKLEGVNEATANVSEDDTWVKQVLHIWTLQPTWVPMLEQAWTALDAELKTDTIVLVTVEEQSTEIVTDSCDD